MKASVVNTAVWVAHLAVLAGAIWFVSWLTQWMCEPFVKHGGWLAFHWFATVYLGMLFFAVLTSGVWDRDIALIAAIIATGAVVFIAVAKTFDVGGVVLVGIALLALGHSVYTRMERRRQRHVAERPPIGRE